MCADIRPDLFAARFYSGARFTISGAVTNGSGQAIADVAMILESDVAAPQIVFTNQSGNYTITYAANLSHNLKVTPSKSGFSFSPLATSFVSSNFVTGDKTASFSGTPRPLPPPGQAPILLTRGDSQRALALDSVTMLSEPFSITNIHNFSDDQHTRILLFAVNVEVGPFVETGPVVEAQAETPGGQTFPLVFEGLHSVPNFPLLTQIILRLPSEIANSDEVLITVKVRGTAGNKVLVKVKP